MQVDADAVLDTGASKATLQIRRQGGGDVGPTRTSAAATATSS